MTTTTMTPTSLYAANRSPTGHATALLCCLVEGTWSYLSETTPAHRVPLSGGEPLYATSEEAIDAALRRWNCDRPRRNLARTPIPTPVLVTEWPPVPAVPAAAG